MHRYECQSTHNCEEGADGNPCAVFMVNEEIGWTSSSDTTSPHHHLVEGVNNLIAKGNLYAAVCFSRVGGKAELLFDHK